MPTKIVLDRHQNTSKLKTMSLTAFILSTLVYFIIAKAVEVALRKFRAKMLKIPNPDKSVDFILGLIWPATFLALIVWISGYCWKKIWKALDGLFESIMTPKSGTLRGTSPIIQQMRENDMLQENRRLQINYDAEIARMQAENNSRTSFDQLGSISNLTLSDVTSLPPRPPRNYYLRPSIPNPIPGLVELRPRNETLVVSMDPTVAPRVEQGMPDLQAIDQTVEEKKPEEKPSRPNRFEII